MSNFFCNPAFGGNGMVSGFRDMNLHASTFNSDFNNHLTFHGTNTHDFSLETTLRLHDYNNMNGLEKRISFLDSAMNSPFGP